MWVVDYIVYYFTLLSLIIHSSRDSVAGILFFSIFYWTISVINLSMLAYMYYFLILGYAHTNGMV